MLPSLTRLLSTIEPMTSVVKQLVSEIKISQILGRGFSLISLIVGTRYVQTEHNIMYFTVLVLKRFNCFDGSIIFWENLGNPDVLVIQTTPYLNLFQLERSCW